MKRFYLLVLLSALALPFGAASARGQRRRQPRRRRGLRGRRQHRRAYANDYVELFNRGASSVALDGWTLQYASASTARSGRSTTLSGLDSGRRPLPRPARLGGTNGAALPTPDATGTSNLAVTGGKVALVDDATALTCGASAGSCSAAPLVEDLVGYGSATDYEGCGAAPALQCDDRARRAPGRLHRHRRQRSRLRRGGAEPARTSSAAASAVLGHAARGGTGGSPRSTSTSQPVLSLSLDHADAELPAVGRRGRLPAPLAEHVTVTSNDRERLRAQRPPDGVLAARPAARHRRRRAAALAAGADRAGAGPSAAGRLAPRAPRRATLADDVGFVSPLPRRPGRALHGDADVHGDRQVRARARRAAPRYGRGSIPGAAAGRGIGLQREPAAADAPTVRRRRRHRAEPGARPLLVDVSRAGFGARCAASRGCARPAASRAGSRLRPRRIQDRAQARRPSSACTALRGAGARRSPGARAPDDAAARREARPGAPARGRDRRPPGSGKDRAPPRAGRLTLRRLGRRRLLELRLVNRGNVTEELGGSGLRLSLFRGRRRSRRWSRGAASCCRIARVSPCSRTAAAFEEPVVARVELRAPVQGPRRSFHLRL